MSVKYILEGLDCANCAAKMESEIAKLEGVNSVSISFMTTKMVLDIKDEVSEETLEQIKKLIKKIEPDTNMKKI